MYNTMLFQESYINNKNLYVEFYFGTVDSHYVRADNILIELESDPQTIVKVRDLYVCACYLNCKSYCQNRNTI